MKNIAVALIIIAFFGSCGEKHIASNSQARRVNDSVKSKRKADRQTVAAGKSENDDPEPSFEDVLAELRTAYNKVEHIDKTVIDGRDTLQLHETYYFLHDSSLIVPKLYVWGGDTTKDFTANTFATKIIVVNNRDTVLNKIFKKTDFDKVLWDRLQQYAIIFTADYIGYDESKGEFALGYSITIPLTDVGVPAAITVDKKGHYKILDEYAKMDGFKKK
jgi:hypothetical protein